jgi:hypothetical protein
MDVCINMIEKDIARLRLLHNVAIKGHIFSSDDIDFLLNKQREIRGIEQGITETLEIARGRYIDA